MASAAVFLAFNVIFFVLQGAASTPCPPPPPNPCPPPPPSSPTPVPPSPSGGGGRGGGGGGGGGKCPRDALKLGVCANVLGLIKAKVGAPPQLPCCSLLQGLVDLEAAVCLCTAIKANILGINLNLPIDLSLILNYCGKGVPPGFKC